MFGRSIHLLIPSDLQLNLNNLPGHLAYGALQGNLFDERGWLDG